MVRKKREESSSRISDGLHARIVRLSQLLWADNRTRMARDVGSDQSTISKVLAGKQEPSAKLLEMLAANPRVNPVWLFTGEGEPLVEVGVRPGLGAFRPLLDELLPGTLDEHRDRLSGVSYPVSAAFDSPTSYWLSVRANSPITKSAHRIKGGDLLLEETHTDWTRRVAAATGRFCGFAIGEGKAESVRLGYVDTFDHAPLDEGYEQYRIDLFEGSDKHWLIVPADAEGEKNARRALSGVCLSLERVVCVCIKLERTFGKEIRHDTEHTRHALPD